MFAEAALPRQADTGLRRFNMRRDLRQLADLIDLAFESEIEAARSSIVAEMRRLSQAGPLLWLLDASYAALAPLMGGFVWIADGRLVGNVTLSADGGARGLWTITNVAVHPAFRRRGIARQLMEAALDEACQKGARAAVLEVQADNAPALQLYHGLGFERYDTVAEVRLPALHGPAHHHLPAVLGASRADAMALRKRRPTDCQKLQDFFEAVTPPAVRAVRPVAPEQYRMDIGLRLKQWLDGWMYRCQRSDWLLERSNKIAAVLQVAGQYTNAPHRLQLDVSPEWQGTVEDELLAAGLQKLVEFPERDVVSTVRATPPQAVEAFHRAGFQTLRVLDQMALRCLGTRGA